MRKKDEDKLFKFLGIIILIIIAGVLIISVFLVFPIHRFITDTFDTRL